MHLSGYLLDTYVAHYYVRTSVGTYWIHMLHIIMYAPQWYLLDTYVAHYHVRTSVGTSEYSFVLSTATTFVSNSLPRRTIQFSEIVIYIIIISVLFESGTYTHVHLSMNLIKRTASSHSVTVLSVFLAD